jgi:hypothetical protein
LTHLKANVETRTSHTFQVQGLKPGAFKRYGSVEFNCVCVELHNRFLLPDVA